MIYSSASPEQIAGDLKGLMDFQDEGVGLEELSRMIEKDLIPHLTRYDRPEFHSLYNCYPEEGAELGARIALQYNQGITNWQVSPGGVMLEELCCQALCRMFGLASDSDGTFMYCGTYANQQALYLALHRKAELKGFNFAEEGLKGFDDPGRLVAVTSTEAHFSLRHALRIMGLGDRSLIAVDVDENRRMDVSRLETAVRSLQQEGREIFCFIATAGTTSTGTVDPIMPVVRLSEEVGAWSHIDGAYGLAFRLVPECRQLFDGIEVADSVSWDPHKAFGTPIPNSLLFVNRREDFNRMAIYGEYFNRKDDPEPNPGLKSPPSTRPFSALPLVTSIRYQGMRKVVERLRAPLNAIRSLAEKLRDEPDIELCHRPDTGILCIRLVPEGFPEEELDNLQKFIYESIKKEGKRSISMTRLDDKTVLRFVAISPCVTCDAMMETVSIARDLAGRYSDV